MKVIVEIEYNPSERTISWLFNILKKAGMKFSIFKIERSPVHNQEQNLVKDNFYSIPFIKKIVCIATEMPEEVLDSKSRQQEIVENRQIAMYLSRKYTRKSLREIGNEFGDKTPATIMHACRTIHNLCQTDKKFQLKLSNIEHQLMNGINIGGS